MIDLNVEPNHETEKWGETRFFGLWNPDENVGIYGHAGRFRKDLDLWWTQACAYLPDRKLAVDRGWGSTPDPKLVRGGNFELEQKEEGFFARFDGAGELTTTEALAAGVRGASAPDVRMQWDVEFDALSPLWDIAAMLGDIAGDAHSQRTFTTKGSMTVDGATYSLDGYGWRDHSSGIRTWNNFSGHHFLVGVTPEYSIHSIMIWGDNGEPRGPIGTIYHRDGREAKIVTSEAPKMDGPECGPFQNEMKVGTADGDEYVYDLEILGQLPIIISDNADNLNGIEWDIGVDTLVLGEAHARFTDQTGNVGHGFFERGRMLDTLERPS